MSCYLVQEIDGARFSLEDETGFLVLDGCVPTPPTDGPPIGGYERKRRRRLGPDSDEEWLSVILTEL